MNMITHMAMFSPLCPFIILGKRKVDAAYINGPTFAICMAITMYEGRFQLSGNEVTRTGNSTHKPLTDNHEDIAKPQTARAVIIENG